MFRPPLTFNFPKSLPILLWHLQCFPLLLLELPTNSPTPALSATMNHSTLPLKAETSQSLSSNVQTLSVPPVSHTIRLPREASALLVFLTMRFLMSVVKSSAETGLRMVLRLVTMAILSVEMAVPLLALRRLITYALDSQAPALFKVSVGIQLKRLPTNPVMMPILFQTMGVQTRAKLKQDTTALQTLLLASPSAEMDSEQVTRPVMTAILFQGMAVHLHAELNRMLFVTNLSRIIVTSVGTEYWNPQKPVMMGLKTQKDAYLIAQESYQYGFVQEEIHLMLTSALPR